MGFYKINIYYKFSDISFPLNDKIKPQKIKLSILVSDKTASVVNNMNMKYFFIPDMSYAILKPSKFNLEPQLLRTEYIMDNETNTLVAKKSLSSMTLFETGYRFDIIPYEDDLDDDSIKLLFEMEDDEYVQ